MSEDEIRKIAMSRVVAKKGVFIHLIVYVVVNAVLVTIWAVTGAGYPWFLWVLGFWGLGLIFNILGVFVFPKEGGEWERREIQKEMERMKKG